MEFIAHRINTVAELENVPFDCGVEVDIRDQGDDLIMVHDPFSDGERFEDYAKRYKHGTMILNIKSERIEYRVLEIIKKYGISDYFFLDSSFPMIYALSEAGEKNIALRFSEYEGFDTLEKMAGKVSWVWVDCFKSFYFTEETFKRIKALGFRVCLVSPELQKRPEEVPLGISIINFFKDKPDAICCKLKNRNEWGALF